MKFLFPVLFLASVSAFARPEYQAVGSDWAACAYALGRRVLADSPYSDVQLSGKVHWSVRIERPTEIGPSFAARYFQEGRDPKGNRFTMTFFATMQTMKFDYDPRTGEYSSKGKFCELKSYQYGQVKLRNRSGDVIWELK